MSASSPVDVHIWFQETEYLDPEALALADQVLSPEERRQRDRFRFPEDRRDYAAAHSLLRRSLSRHAASRHAASRHPASRHPSDWHFEKNAFGKPYLSGGTDEEIALEFSLSHTRGFVACAIAPARVGIDVERARQNVDYEEIAQSNFSRREIEALEELPGEARSVRVLELWTLKEAFLKAIGRGLSVELDSVVFELSPSGAIRLHAGGGVDANSWKFALFVPRPEVRMAVAVESPGSPRLFLQDRDVAEFRSDSGSALAQPWRGF